MIKALLMAKHFTPASAEELKIVLGKKPADAKAIFCTNASDGLVEEGIDTQFVDLAKEEVKNAGYVFDELDLREYIGKVAELIDLVGKYDVIFFTGGDSGLLLKYFHKTGLFDKYRELLENGLIHVGFSAGSMIFSKEMKYLSFFRSSDKLLAENAQGLGLFPHYLVPHYFDKPKYTKVFEDSMKKYPNVQYIPLTNHQGIVLEGEEWRII